MKKISCLFLVLIFLNSKAQNFPFDKSGEIVQQVYVDGLWLNTYREVFTYFLSGDSECYQELVESFEWDGNNSIWKEDSRYTYAYNQNTQVTSILSEDLDDTDQWISASLKTYTYNSFGLKETETTTNYESGVAVPSSLFTFGYNENAQVVSLLLQMWNQAEQVWVNSTWTVFEYNNSDEITATEFKTWNDQIQDWTNISRSENTYLENQIIQENFIYTNAQWTLTSRTTKDLNDAGKVTIELHEMWNQFASTWIVFESITFTYDNESGVLLSKTYENAVDAENSVFVPVLQLLYSDHCSLVGQFEMEAKDAGILFYSNPGSELRMSLNGFNGEKIHLQVLDIQGRQVYSGRWVFQDGQMFNLELPTISEGIYKIVVTGSTKNSVGTWLKQ